MSEQKHGTGLWGWLGRQIGYVSKAVKTDVARSSDVPQVVYRKDTVNELPHPNDPAVKLRRTVIDEVIVPPGKSSSEK